MRVVFLDIDGVLLTLPPDGHFEAELKPSAEAVSNLNLLVQVTQARVVVTSHWRIGRTLEQVEDLLKSWGYLWTVFDMTIEPKGEEDRGAKL